MDCRSRPRRRHLRLRGRHFDGDFLDGGKTVRKILQQFDWLDWIAVAIFIGSVVMAAYLQSLRHP